MHMLPAAQGPECDLAHRWTLEVRADRLVFRPVGDAMTAVGAFEAKTHFAQLLERVQRGEEITITRRGKPVARLVPAPAKHDPEVAMAIFHRLRSRAKQQGAPKFDWSEWKSYVDKGRP
jgi:prevent-host-death family protein